MLGFYRQICHNKWSQSAHKLPPRGLDNEGVSKPEEKLKRSLRMKEGGTVKLGLSHNMW